jgi:drug/metabolite transporter (DMT)-like permease
VLATAALGVLSLRGLVVSPGVLLTAAGAFLYALQILALSRWARPADVYASSFVQLGTCAALCTLAALPGGISVPRGGGDRLAVLYLAVVAGALVLVAQNWAQAHLTATRAAIVMTTEPVWASTFAILLGGEALSGRLLLGGPLVLAAMALAELPLPGRRNRRTVHEPAGGRPASAARSRRWTTTSNCTSPTVPRPTHATVPAVAHPSAEAG